ncbi:hypothetical protein ACI65C_004831 [Semiaphis heraclei]
MMASKRVDEIISKILDYPSFLNNDGEPPAWSSKIWKLVADNINSSAIDGQKCINSQYLYTLVKENRYDILTSIRTKLGFNEEPNIFQISDEPSPSEIARITLSECIATGEFALDMVTDEDVYKGINDNDEFYISEFNVSSDSESQIYTWIEYIHSTSKDEASIRGDRLNALYCPGIVKPLLATCREFPLWTGVLLEHFNSPNKRGSSARIESYFANLKTSILSKKTSRMRADKFIVTHF